MAKQPKPKQIRITEIIAVNKTADARKLLKKYGMPDAKGYADLENKLSELYNKVEDKKQLEKEIAEMHPHKRFILDNLSPAPVETKSEEIIEPVESKRGKLTIVDSGYSNAEGDSHCDCHNCRSKKYSNACGCGSYSGFDGNQSGNQTALQQHNNQIAMIATVGLIGLFAFMIYKHKNG